MKKTASLSPVLLTTALVLLPGVHAPASAQPSVPDESSRPILSPGRVGPQGAQGLKDASRPILETTVADIMEAPARHANRNVRVASIIKKVFTPWTIELDDRAPLRAGIDNDLLVIGAEPLATMGFKPEWHGRQVVVEGTIRILQAADFRREYGRGVDDRLFRTYEGKPGLIATSIRLAE